MLDRQAQFEVLFDSAHCVPLPGSSRLYRVSRSGMCQWGGTCAVVIRQVAHLCTSSVVEVW
jgi:hypothetical protein